MHHNFTAYNYINGIKIKQFLPPSYTFITPMLVGLLSKGS